MDQPFDAESVGDPEDIDLVRRGLDDALDVVGMSVRQSCFRMDSEDALPGLQDERSVMSFF